MTELSISMALSRVRDAVKKTFRGVRDEVIPLYMANGTEHRDARESAQRTTEPFEKLLTALMHDSFKVADARVRTCNMLYCYLQTLVFNITVECYR